MSRSAIAGLVGYTTLSLLGVAFAAPLTVIIGVFDLLPLIGATIAAIIVGVVTLFYNFPTDTIIWAVVVLVYQQIENNVPGRSSTGAQSRCRRCWCSSQC